MDDCETASEEGSLPEADLKCGQRGPWPHLKLAELEDLFSAMFFLSADACFHDANISGANQSLCATVQTSNLNYVMLIQRSERGRGGGIWKNVISNGRLSAKLFTHLCPLD